MPNLNAAFWTARVDVPAFFASRAYRHYLRPGQTIIAIPYGVSGNTMLWQAEAGLYFTMAGGYTGIIPREFERWPVVRAFSTATLIPDSRAQLRAFMAAHQSSVIVADDQRPTPWTNVFLKLDPSRVRIAGVTLYRVPSRELIPYRKFTSAEMERRNCAARFDALLSAARDYLRVGGDPSRLTPMRAQQLNLLPGNWVNRSEVRTNNGLYLGPWNHGKIAIGVVASYDAGRPLIDRYRADASEVLFPFPKTFADPPRGDTFMRLLVLVFDRAAVLRAVAKAGYPPD